MSSKSLFADSTLDRYISAQAQTEPEILQRLRAETSAHPQAIMQIAPEQGHFFSLLVRAIGARKTLEVGVFTGYSSLAVALALPEDGRLIACDVSEEYTSVARRYWLEAGVTDKIDLRIAPAAQTLTVLINEGHAGTFDFVFIDADKTGYNAYYELALQLLRKGGLIALDNMLQSGKVADPTQTDASTEAIRVLNAKIAKDERVAATLLPLADGVTLALKK